MDDNLIFQAEDVCKVYPGTVALNKASMEIKRGEVIGFVGENGAGKSTLLKLIMGVEKPSSGKMWLHGKEYAPKSPVEANKNGVGMVFQEQSIISNLTVGQNIFFGKESQYKFLFFLKWRQLFADAKDALESVGITNINARTNAGELTFAQRQMVEIAKVINLAKTSGQEGSLIMLDEPTSVLGDSDIQELFKQIELLKSKGNSVIFVSHRLDEVLHIADTIYVFKDGTNVGILNKTDAKEALIYEMMVGRTTTGKYYKTERQMVPTEEVVLEARNLSVSGAFKNVAFQLHRGEILGICGVVGSGKEDICSVITGDIKPSSGELLLNGKPVEFGSPFNALKNGILSVPKERREEGIMSILTIMQNVSLSAMKKIGKSKLISKKKEIQLSEYWIKRLSVKCSGYNEQAGELSGGNAQKVVFARVLASGATILVLDHPTRGVDVGAREEIYSIIRDMTDQGFSVIMLGDTLDECIGMSSKIIVMKDGLITQMLDASAENKPSEVDIVRYMM